MFVPINTTAHVASIEATLRTRQFLPFGRIENAGGQAET